VLSGYVYADGRFVDPKVDGWFVSEDSAPSTGAFSSPRRLGEFVKIGGESVDLGGSTDPARDCRRRRRDRRGRRQRLGHVIHLASIGDAGAIVEAFNARSCRTSASAPCIASMHSALAAGQAAAQCHPEPRTRRRTAMTFLGIVVPSLLLVVAVRRWIAPLPWRMAALFLALTLLFCTVRSSRAGCRCRWTKWRSVIRGAAWSATSSRAIRHTTHGQALSAVDACGARELLHLRAPLWNRYRSAAIRCSARGVRAVLAAVPGHPIVRCRSRSWPWPD